MDAETRAEINALHHLLNEANGRIVTLEANGPHVNEKLAKIERGVDRINGHFVKAIWIVVGLFAVTVGKFTVDGGWSIPLAG